MVQVMIIIPTQRSTFFQLAIHHILHSAYANHVLFQNTFIGTGEFVEIFVQTGTGKCTTLMVQPSATIKHVKDKIKEKGGLPPDEQYTLSFDGKILEDGCTVSSYNVKNRSTLFGANGKA